MVFTIIQAKVDPENWQTLQEAFNTSSQGLPPGILQTSLVQDRNDKDLWQIITLWESLPLPDPSRGPAPTPRGEVIFQMAHATPTHAVFDVAAQKIRNAA